MFTLHTSQIYTSRQVPGHRVRGLGLKTDAMKGTTQPRVEALSVASMGLLDAFQRSDQPSETAMAWEADDHQTQRSTLDVKAD